MFEGFSDKTTEFLWGIRLNNEKPWFEAHKSEYTQYVQTPLKELGQELFLAMQDEHPDLMLRLHVCRIYRDARRLFGRGPFKNHLWFTIFSGEDEQNAPAFWFEIDPIGYGFGMGCFPPNPSFMGKFRRSIDERPEIFLKLAKGFSKQNTFKNDAESYKRPKGNPPEPLSDWYNRKTIDLSCRREADDVFCSSELVKEILDGFRELYPIYEYLIQVSRRLD